MIDEQHNPRCMILESNNDAEVADKEVGDYHDDDDDDQGSPDSFIDDEDHEASTR